MSTTRIALSAPLFASLLAAAGCANGPNDSLTGSWSNAACFGSTAMPADIQVCSTSLDFGADLSVTLTDTRQAQPATLMFPRCTTTRRVTGLRYSTSDGTATTRTVTLSGTSTATVERTGCANPVDNTAAMPDNGSTVPAGAVAYELRTDTLVIASGTLAGQYTRSSR